MSAVVDLSLIAAILHLLSHNCAKGGGLSGLGGLALLHDGADQCRWLHRWLIFIPPASKTHQCGNCSFALNTTRLLYSRRNVIPMPFAAWMGLRVVWVTMAMTWQTFSHIAWECRFFIFLILQIQRHLARNTYELCTFKWICSLNRSKQIDGARPQGRWHHKDVLVPGRHPAGAPADLSVQTPGLQMNEWFKGFSGKRGMCSDRSISFV